MSSFLETKEAYSGWLERLSIQYQQSQIKAAVSVNREMLTFYWLLGRDIISMRESSKWGSGFLETLSRDLRQRIPGAKCFSVTNLRYMEYFYTFFPARTETPPQVGDELNLPMLPIIHPQVGEDLFNIPWGHIKLIIDKCKQDSQKAKFYIQETVKNNWSRAVLQNWIDTDLYARQGKAISNFAHSLPTPQSDLAQAITRDPYNFDFIERTVAHNEREMKEHCLRMSSVS
jgi:predicted nuclease of restriction endonuclease-like (RecB) superfamily